MSSKRLALSFLTVAIVALAPLPAHAYFSPQTLSLLAHSLNPAVAGGIITFIAHAIVYIKHLSPLRRGALITGLVIMVMVPSFLLIHKVLELREINKVSRTVSVEELDAWQRFSEQLSGADGDVFSRAHATNQLDLAKLTHRVNLEEGIKSKQYRVVDILCSSSPVRDSEQNCGMSYEIYSNFDDREAVEAIMNRYGYDKQDPLLLYCEAGFTTSRIAFILQQYGYNVAWGALDDIKDFSLIDTRYGPRVNTKIIVDTFPFADDREYSYILFNYDDQTPFYYDPRFRDQLNDNFHFFVADDDYDFRLFNQIGLTDKVQPADSTPAELIAGHNLVCWDNLHCYLTRQYLGYREINNVSTLYCILCDDQ